MGHLACNRYALEALVGRSAGMVYRAHDVVFDHQVAIKVLLPGASVKNLSSRALQLWFREEALAAMRLSHPKIARVFNCDRHEEWDLLVMEYIAGEDLRTHRRSLPDGRVPLSDALRFAAECLEDAHANGVVHNDIKPSNLLITRAGALKIFDFGLARLVSARERLDSRDSAGTSAFMSPERILGEEGDARSVIYALGATL